MSDYGPRPFDPSVGTDTISYVRDFPLEEYGRDYFPHGLHYGAGWLQSRFVEVDTGVSYNFVREFQPGNSIFCLMLQRGDKGSEDVPLYNNPGELFTGYTQG